VLWQVLRPPQRLEFGAGIALIAVPTASFIDGEWRSFTAPPPKAGDNRPLNISMRTRQPSHVSGLNNCSAAVRVDWQWHRAYQHCGIIAMV